MKALLDNPTISVACPADNLAASTSPNLLIFERFPIITVLLNKLFIPFGRRLLRNFFVNREFNELNELGLA